MAQQTKEEKKDKPAKTFRYGNVKGAIWAQTTADRVWFSLAITRSYKQGEEWSDTTRFNRDDLPLVKLIADKAFEWIWDQQAHARESED